ELANQVQNLLTNNGEGNPAFTNLPRKFNIAIAGCCDNSTHAEINDLAFIPAFKETSKETFGFNVIVGGFFSAKRVEAAIPLNVWVPPEDVVALCEALLIVYRDHGLRENRAKSRLMFLIDEWGIERFRAEVEKQLGKPLATAETKDEIAWEKRDHIGVHPQKQSGLNYVGLQIPVGRMYAPDMFEFARLADVFGKPRPVTPGEQRLVDYGGGGVSALSGAALSRLLGRAPAIGEKTAAALKELGTSPGAQTAAAVGGMAGAEIA
ncbi:MAG: ferredoxin--nitrite reductase, partial [Pseudanabaena sp.]